MKQNRWKLHLAVAAVAIAAMTMALTPALADPVPDTEGYPDVAFLARNDVPFDAQTAASMAAQLGAPMFITNPGALSDAAANGISDLNPDVIIVAGGEFAISEDVATTAAAECDPNCTIDRRFGAGRDQTAAALAEIAADYGFDRPVLQGSNHVAGDVHVGGTVSANALTIEDTGLVSGLNADRVDGMHADDFLGATDKAADSDLLDGRDSAAFVERLWAVIRSDGTFARGERVLAAGRVNSTGTYEVIFDRDVTGCSYTATIGNPGTGISDHGSIVTARLTGDANGVLVNTRDFSNTSADRPFHLQVIC